MDTLRGACRSNDGVTDSSSCSPIPLNLVHTEYCNLRGCIEQWQEWSKCSKSCGAGTRVRMRDCNHGNCFEHKIEEEACNDQGCLAPWSRWTQCGVNSSQDIYKRERKRSCDGGPGDSEVPSKDSDSVNDSNSSGSSDKCVVENTLEETQFCHCFELKADETEDYYESTAIDLIVEGLSSSNGNTETTQYRTSFLGPGKINSDKECFYDTEDFKFTFKAVGPAKVNDDIQSTKITDFKINGKKRNTMEFLMGYEETNVKEIIYIAGEENRIETECANCDVTIFN